jgi:hypothetical protein
MMAGFTSPPPLNYYWFAGTVLIGFSVLSWLHWNRADPLRWTRFIGIGAIIAIGLFACAPR